MTAKRRFYVNEVQDSEERIAAMVGDHLGDETDFNPDLLEEDEILTKYEVIVTVKPVKK